MASLFTAPLLTRIIIPSPFPGEYEAVELRETGDSETDALVMSVFNHLAYQASNPEPFVLPPTTRKKDIVEVLSKLKDVGWPGAHLDWGSTSTQMGKCSMQIEFK